LSNANGLRLSAEGPANVASVGLGIQRGPAVVDPIFSHAIDLQSLSERRYLQPFAGIDVKNLLLTRLGAFLKVLRPASVNLPVALNRQRCACQGHSGRPPHNGVLQVVVDIDAN